MILLIDFTTIISAILVFTILILLMALMLIFARKKLVPEGNVEIIINGDEEKPLLIQPGSSLLSSLADQNIFLPSACGGGGTCAMCTCRVYSGGGDILPTELNHISRKDAEANMRLACQVKVRDNMKIGIPEEIFGIKKWECEVVSNYNVASFIKEFIVRLPEGETLDFEPGGYVQIDVPETTVEFKNFDIAPLPDDPSGNDKFKSEWDDWKLWDLKMVNDEPQFRAYSMANHPAEGDIVMLNIRIATPPFDRNKNGWSDVNPGVCSSYVFDQKPGDKITISGPYGEFFIKDTKKEILEEALTKVIEEGSYYTINVSKILTGSQENDVRTEIKDRELEFIKLACTEMNYREIADIMCCSYKTVEGYRDSLYRKLGIKNRIGLVLFAIHHNLFTP